MARRCSGMDFGTENRCYGHSPSSSFDVTTHDYVRSNVHPISPSRIVSTQLIRCFYERDGFGSRLMRMQREGQRPMKRIHNALREETSQLRTVRKA